MVLDLVLVPVPVLGSVQEMVLAQVQEMVLAQVQELVPVRRNWLENLT